MADRTINRPAVITADIEMHHTIALLTVRDSAGIARIQDEAMSPLGDGRWTYTANEGVMNRSGVWQATVSDGTSEITYFTFTVGPRVPAGMSYSETRYAVANRAGRVVSGVVSESDDLSISDGSLIGGPKNYRGQWLQLAPPHPEQGRYRRIVDYNGSSLVFDQPFVSPVPVGTKFYLYKDHPKDIDMMIATSIGDIAEMSRIPTTVSGVPAVSRYVEIPVGLRDVMEVWINDGTTERQLARTEYSTLPGRRLLLVESLSSILEVSITGIRALEVPVWENSVIDTEPGVVNSRAAQLLHAKLASGQASDLDEHMRRSMMCAQEWEAALRKSVGRKMTSLPVLD